MNDDLECLSFDIDLFFNAGVLNLHFATAGGYVRKEIYTNPSHRLFRSELLSTKAPKMEFTINPNLDKILSLKFESQKINQGSVSLTV
jgi:hypothetical protein